MKKLSFSASCLLFIIISLAGCASVDATSSTSEAAMQKNPDEVKLMVLYPQPADAAQFDKDYLEHLELLHEKANISENEPLPYTVTKFFPSPDGPADYYQVFIMTFASAAALQQAMGTPGMQEVAADAARISTGGGPVVVVGSQVLP